MQSKLVRFTTVSLYTVSGPVTALELDRVAALVKEIAPEGHWVIVDLLEAEFTPEVGQRLAGFFAAARKVKLKCLIVSNDPNARDASSLKNALAHAKSSEASLILQLVSLEKDEVRLTRKLADVTEALKKFEPLEETKNNLLKEEKRLKAALTLYDGVITTIKKDALKPEDRQAAPEEAEVTLNGAKERVFQALTGGKPA